MEKYSQRLIRTVLVLMPLLGITACGDEYRAEKQLERLGKNSQYAEDEYKKAAQRYDSISANMYRHQNTIRAERNQREFDRIAVDGGLGTSEQLKVMKREMDNPSYQSQQSEAARRAEGSLQFLEKQIEGARLELQQKQTALQKANSELAAGERELARIRAAKK
jgi:predicted  nucleic acid-binding Zn-ribbon protein